MNKTLKSKLTASDIIHHFANRTAKAEKSGQYSYENNMLYYSSRCIAKIISVRKKIVVIDNTFNRTGAYGNGYGHWHITNAFSDDWAILFSNKVSIAENTIESLYSLYFNTISSSIFKMVDRYQMERELITNSLASSEVYHSDIDIERLFELADKLKLSKNKILKYVYNEVRTSIIRYKGWGKTETSAIRIDKPISFWLEPQLWHNEEENKILEFKKWKQIWRDKGNTYGKRYIDIYNDPVLKEEFEKRTTARLNKMKADAEERERLRDIERAKEDAEKIEQWKKGEYLYSIWRVPTQLRIRETIVETSMGANIPVSHAERLFKFFTKCVESNTVYISKGNNQSVDAIGVYHLREINKNDEGIWYLKAGCHTIYKDAIDDFIKRYNLNW